MGNLIRTLNIEAYEEDEVLVALSMLSTLFIAMTCDDSTVCRTDVSLVNKRL